MYRAELSHPLYPEEIKRAYYLLREGPEMRKRLKKYKVVDKKNSIKFKSNDYFFTYYQIGIIEGSSIRAVAEGIELLHTLNIVLRNYRPRILHASKKDKNFPSA